MQANVRRLVALFLLVIFSAITVSPVAADVSFHTELRPGGNVCLPVSIWQDKTAGDTKGVVILVHGISQRAYTLRSIAHKLADNGFIVYGIDLRGHGWWRANLNKGDVGYRSDYKGSLKDLKQLLARLKLDHPGLPTFIVGESVGASLALRAAVNCPQAVDGLVLCGAGTKSQRVKLSWFVSDLIRGVLKRPINIVRYQRKYGTDDVVALEETIADPWQRKTFSLAEVLQARGYCAKNRKFAKQLAPNISVLMVSGADDRIFTTKSTRQVFAALPGCDKDLVMVPDCGHILLGTTRLKPQVAHAVESFIRDRVRQMQVAGSSSTY